MWSWISSNWCVMNNLLTEAKHVWCEQRDGLQCGSVQQEGPDPDQSHRHPAQVAALPARSGPSQLPPPAACFYYIQFEHVLFNEMMQKYWILNTVCRCGRQWRHPSESEQRAAAGERPHQVQQQYYTSLCSLSQMKSFTFFPCLTSKYIFVWIFTIC